MSTRYLRVLQRVRPEALLHLPPLPLVRAARKYSPMIANFVAKTAQTLKGEGLAASFVMEG
jgi:hypothetical protein